MPLAHFPNGTIFFAHIPKTGGTSIENYLVRRFGTLSINDRNKRERRPRTGLINPASHLAAEDLEELIPPDVAYVFAVVREPVERLMSEYRYQMNASHMSRFGFSTWLRVMLHGARVEPRLYQNHIRPQVDLIPDGSDIYKLEDGFETLIARIDNVVGASAPEIEMRHLNKRPKRDLRLTREDAALITSFYARDFKELDYEPPSIDGLEKDRLVLLRDVMSRILAFALVQKQRWRWAR